MSETNGSRPCPVCLGTDLSRLSAGDELELDHCEQCHGIWFDAGEAERLTKFKLPAIWRERLLGEEHHVMSCHGCGAAMDRNAPRCEACDWQNEVDCPVCREPMVRQELQGFVLDYCDGCRGVWFDKIELSEIWLLRLNELQGRPRRHHLAAELTGEVAGQFVVEGVLEAIASIAGAILD